MNKFEKEYDSEKNNYELEFYKSLTDFLIQQDQFYKLDTVIIKESDKKINCTANIVFINKRNVSKKYVAGKKTNDESVQVFSNELKGVEK